MSDESSVESVEPTSSHDNPTPQQALATIQDALTGLRYGHVTVIVHNGVVVQVERLEKRRLRADS